MHDVDGLNAGYARLLLDEYLENPEAVPASGARSSRAGDSDLVATLPGLARLLGQATNGSGNGARQRARRTELASAGVERAGSGAARRRRRGDGARQGAPHARPSRGAPRSARRRAARRSVARPAPARSAADPGAPGSDPRVSPRHRRRRRDPRGCPPAPAGDLLRDDGLRDRAHRRPRAARLVAPGDRVVALPHAARAPRRSAPSTSGSARSRARSATCGAPSSARSSSRSRAST